MTTANRLIIHTDGASRGNPGPAAYAYVIEGDGQADVEVKCYMGQSTNNVAEYTAMVKALEHARELGGRDVVVHSDSELMVKQMNGEYRVKNEALLPLYEEATRLRREFASVALRHVRREQNSRADRLCNEALDDPRSAAPRRAGTTPAPNPVTDVRRRAIALLEECAARWADADPTSPGVEQVWDRLWQMLREAKLVRE